MKLIPDWRHAWDYLSVKVQAIAGAAVAGWLLLPEDQRASLIALLPFNFGGKGPALLVLLAFMGGIFARLKAQPDLPAKRAAKGAPMPDVTAPLPLIDDDSPSRP